MSVDQTINATGSTIVTGGNSGQIGTSAGIVGSERRQGIGMSDLILQTNKSTEREISLLRDEIRRIDADIRRIADENEQAGRQQRDDFGKQVDKLSDSVNRLSDSVKSTQMWMTGLFAAGMLSFVFIFAVVAYLLIMK